MQRPNGFTLIELTITIAIVAVLAAAVVSAFSTGLQVWSWVQKESDANQEQTAVMEAVARDLRNVFTVINGERAAFVLEEEITAGRPASSLYLTTLATSRENEEIAHCLDIAYKFNSQENTLLRFEAVHLEDDAQAALAMENAEEEVVSDNVTGFYLRGWDGSEWQAVWPPAEVESQEASFSLPHMVEIAIEFSGDKEAAKGRMAVATIPLEMAHP